MTKETTTRVRLSGEGEEEKAWRSLRILCVFALNLGKTITAGYFAKGLSLLDRFNT